MNTRTWLRTKMACLAQDHAALCDEVAAFGESKPAQYARVRLLYIEQEMCAIEHALSMLPTYPPAEG